MAEPIKYRPQPARIGPDAHEELARLLQTAHEHGVLRFANDLIAANTAWAKVLVDGLNGPGARNAVQNLAVIGMVLSRIEPARMYKLAFALKEAADRLDESINGEAAEPPGVSGAYRMLHDESLWRGIAPLLDALRAFAGAMHRRVDKPISEFSGKPTAD